MEIFKCQINLSCINIIEILHFSNLYFLYIFMYLIYLEGSSIYNLQVRQKNPLNYLKLNYKLFYYKNSVNSLLEIL